MKRLRITCILPESWNNLRSGVFTFIRIVIPLWQKRHDCIVVTEGSDALVYAKARTPLQRRCKTERRHRAIILGYVRMLFCELRRLWPKRYLFRGRLILLNEFGSEIRPITMRVVCPFGCIVAIAHTHPNPCSKDIAVRRWVEGLCYWSCSRVVFNSLALKQMWELKLGRQIRKGVVVHHGMDVPSECHVPEGYPDRIAGVVDVVCVGLFYRWKGQLALIDAWPGVMANCQVPVRLVLVGDGPCFEKAKSRVVELGLEGHVVFCGFQSAGADFFNGGDIAIHYPVEPEAFGLVLLEAMGRGKPVIAPAHGGATEIVVDGVTGFLVEPVILTADRRPQTADLNETRRHEDTKLVGSDNLNHKDTKIQKSGGMSLDQIAAGEIEDPNSLQSAVCGLRSESEARLSLVEAVCRLAEDAELRQRMGAAGRERVRTEFSVDKMLAGYDRVFRELGAERRGRGR